MPFFDAKTKRFERENLYVVSLMKDDIDKVVYLINYEHRRQHSRIYFKLVAVT